MAVDPSMLAALQGPSSGPDPMAGLFGVSPEHLQQMAGDLLMFPTTRTLLQSPAAKTYGPGQPIIGETASGKTRVLGADPYAIYKADTSPAESNVRTLPGNVYHNYMQMGGGKPMGMLHPSPADLQRYLTEQGLVPY